MARLTLLYPYCSAGCVLSSGFPFTFTTVCCPAVVSYAGRRLDCRDNGIRSIQSFPQASRRSCINASLDQLAIVSPRSPAPAHLNASTPCCTSSPLWRKRFAFSQNVISLAADLDHSFCFLSLPRFDRKSFRITHFFFHETRTVILQTSSTPQIVPCLQTQILSEQTSSILTCEHFNITSTLSSLITNLSTHILPHQ
jgi:hypothetical protein